MSQPSGSAWIRTGLFALPVYGVILAIGTLRPQPDQSRDPDGWARFVSTPSYLLEHVLTNVVGTALVILGTFALGALLASTRARRLGLTGMVISIVGYVLFTVPGVISTFATPAIGAAYLRGSHDVMTLAFPDSMTVIVLLALLLAVIGNILLGVAIWRCGAVARWAGGVWIAATVIFYLLGFALGMATVGASLPTQPIGAALMAVSGAAIAWTVVRRAGTSEARTSTSVPAP
jgi:hypothetical protein